MSMGSLSFISTENIIYQCAHSMWLQLGHGHGRFLSWFVAQHCRTVSAIHLPLCMSRLPLSPLLLCCPVLVPFWTDKLAVAYRKKNSFLPRQTWVSSAKLAESVEGRQWAVMLGERKWMEAGARPLLSAAPPALSRCTANLVLQPGHILSFYSQKR